jgi:hypothetical protein
LELGKIPRRRLLSMVHALEEFIERQVYGDAHTQDIERDVIRVIPKKAQDVRLAGVGLNMDVGEDYARHAEEGFQRSSIGADQQLAAASSVRLTDTEIAYTIDSPPISVNKYILNQLAKLAQGVSLTGRQRIGTTAESLVRRKEIEKGTTALLLEPCVERLAVEKNMAAHRRVTAHVPVIALGA